jgi:hypothetical protein
MSNDTQHKLKSSGEAAEEKSASKSPESPQQPCAGESAWIELELFDEHDKAISNEKYVLVLADGTERKGKTDAKGMVRVEGIAPGTCKVVFPWREPSWWKTEPEEEPPPPVEPQAEIIQAELPASAVAWLEIELVDEEGNPLAGEPYWVQFPDGEVQEGALDEYGLARIEGTISGTCVVRFPNIDKNDWELSPDEWPEEPVATD